MAYSIFDDETVMPDDNALAEALGQSKESWDEIQRHFRKENIDIQNEWKFSGQKHGWGMRVVYKKRRILYLGPRNGFFVVTFSLGERAVAAAEKSTLSESVKDLIRNTKKYVDGRWIRMDVRLPENIEDIKKLIEIKMAK